MSDDLVIHWIEVEGIGYYDVGAASTVRYRFCTTEPTSPTIADRWIAGMNVPQSVAAELDRFEGTFSTNSLSFTMPCDSECSPHFLRTFARPETYLTTDFTTPADNAANVNDSTGMVVNDIMYVGLEAMRIQVIGGGHLLTVERGVLGTQAVPHLSDVGEDRDVYLYNHILRGRRVYLYEDPDSPTLRWVGLIKEINRPSGQAKIRVSCRSGNRLLDAGIGQRRWTVEGGPYARVWPYDGRQFTKWEAVPEQAVGPVSTHALVTPPSVTNPYVVLEFEDGAVYARGRLDELSVVTCYEDELYPPGKTFEDLDLSGYGQEVLTTFDDDYNWFRKRTLAGVEQDPTKNPFLVALILLLSTGTETNYDAGDSWNYDVLPSEWGLRVPRDMVDVEAWEEASLYFSGGVEADKVILRKTDGVETLKKLLWPIGAMVAVDSDGRLTPVDLVDYHFGIESITQDDLYENATTVNSNLAEILEKVAIEWTEDTKDTVYSPLGQQWYPDQDAQQIDIDASWYDDVVARSYLRNNAIALVATCQHPPPRFELHVRPDAFVDVLVGDVFQLSHTMIIDESGSFSSRLVDALMWVESMTYVPSDRSWRVRCLYVGHDIGRIGAISPAGLVDYYDPATKRVYLQDGTFSGGDDWEYFTVSDRLRLLDGNGEERSDPTQQQVEVVSTVADYIEIDNHFDDSGGGVIYPEWGDLVVGVDYQYADNGETDKFHYWADSNGDVDGVDGYEYTRD